MDGDQRLAVLKYLVGVLVRQSCVGAGISNCPSLCVSHRTEKKLVWTCWEIGSTVVRPATERRRSGEGGKGSSKGRSAETERVLLYLYMV